MTNQLKNYKEYATKTLDYLNSIMPPGITLEVDYYISMLAIKPKTYVLRDTKNNNYMKGVSIKGRGMELFGRDFLSKSIELIMTGQREKIKFIYQKLVEDIKTQSLPIEYYCKSQEIKKTTDKYLMEKKKTDQVYEMIIKSGRVVPPGTRVHYYIDSEDNYRFMDEFDTETPNLNIKHYLERLDKITERLHDPKEPELSVLTSKEYYDIFNPPQKKRGRIQKDIFNFKDFYSPGHCGGKWMRYEESNIIDFLVENPLDSYCTIQSFRNDNQDDESHICDVYFDFDAPISDEVKELIKQTDDIEQKIKILQPIIETTRNDVLKTIDYLKSHYSFEDKDFAIFFSGFKGFHLILNGTSFSAGNSDTTYHIKYIIDIINKELGLNTLDVGSIYSKRRMFRIPFSVNSKSGLIKTPICLAKLQDVNYIDNIINIQNAVSRTLLQEDKKEVYTNLFRRLGDIYNTSNNMVFRSWLENNIQEYVNTQTISACKKPSYKYHTMKQYPECIKNLLMFGIRKSGDRNKGTINLACFFKEFGLDIKEATDIITDWARNIDPLLTSSDKTVIINSTKTCVNTVYSSDRYYFSCAGICSLGTKDKPITCIKSCNLKD